MEKQDLELNPLEMTQSCKQKFEVAVNIDGESNSQLDTIEKNPSPQEDNNEESQESSPFLEKEVNIIPNQENVTNQEFKTSHHARIQHFLVLLQFFFFSVFLLFTDIASDIVTAQDFYLGEHRYWGLFTTLPIFSPLLARIILSFISFCRCFKRHEYKRKLVRNRARFSLWCQDLRQLI